MFFIPISHVRYIYVLDPTIFSTPAALVSMLLYLDDS